MALTWNFNYSSKGVVCVPVGTWGINPAFLVSLESPTRRSSLFDTEFLVRETEADSWPPGSGSAVSIWPASSIFPERSLQGHSIPNDDRPRHRHAWLHADKTGTVGKSKHGHRAPPPWLICNFKQGTWRLWSISSKDCSERWNLAWPVRSCSQTAATRWRQPRHKPKG